MNSRQNGLFIVLEGCDLVGKSTQVQILRKTLEDRYGEDRVISIAFPDYDSFTGHFISDFLQERVKVVAAPNTQLSTSLYPGLVFQCVHACDKFAWAARIARYLEAGKIVVTGRWIPSAVIYGKADGLGTAWTEEIYSLLPKPDLNILLDVDPEKVQSRINLRGQTADSFDKNLEKQRKLAAYYFAYWTSKIHADCAWRWRIVNAEPSIDEVAQAIWREIDIPC